MNFDRCALIIPSAVHVSARHTSLVDPEERKRQYLDSIDFFIRESPLSNLVICDNSGAQFPGALYDLALSRNKKLELLSFRGNHELVAKFGKGYGEGEIMQYVLSNSSLLKTMDGFLKVTGRLKVLNVAAMMKDCDQRENYFNPVSLLRPRFMVPKAARACVDTRVYYATRSFFTGVLQEAYKDVRDDEIFFLEHAYYKAIAMSTVNVKCFPVAPEIIGMSGSNGWSFKERPAWKKMLIRLVSSLGYIRTVDRPYKKK